MRDTIIKTFLIGISEKVSDCNGGLQGLSVFTLYLELQQQSYCYHDETQGSDVLFFHPQSWSSIHSGNIIFYTLSNFGTENDHNIGLNTISSFGNNIIQSLFKQEQM